MAWPMTRAEQSRLILRRLCQRLGRVVQSLLRQVSRLGLQARCSTTTSRRSRCGSGVLSRSGSLCQLQKTSNDSWFDCHPAGVSLALPEKETRAPLASWKTPTLWWKMPASLVRKASRISATPAPINARAASLQGPNRDARAGLQVPPERGLELVPTASKLLSCCLKIFLSNCGRADQTYPAVASHKVGECNCSDLPEGAAEIADSFGHRKWLPEGMADRSHSKERRFRSGNRDAVGDPSTKQQHRSAHWWCSYRRISQHANRPVCFIDHPGRVVSVRPIEVFAEDTKALEGDESSRQPRPRNGSERHRATSDPPRCISLT